MLINEFWKIPFLRLIIPFVTGIVVASYLNFSQDLLLGLSLFFIALAFVNRPFLDHSPSYHSRWIFGLVINIGLLLTGAYLTTKSMSYDRKIADSQMLLGIVNKPLKVNPNSIKLELKTTEYQSNNIWHTSKAIIMVTLEKDSIAKLLKYGDLILIKGNIKEINNAGNPSEFDYKKYLARKHIHYKTYQNSEQWVLVGKNEGNPVFAQSFAIRDSLLNIYLESGIKGEEFGLLAALTLGTMDYLSDEIIEAYSESGAMHVLSVSGLHVGIIFIVLNQLLFFLNKKRYLKILQAFLIIFAIWFFALLTGLSPSVNRSAAMLSFVIIGKVSKKRPSTYNTVFASAFILLLIEPLTLFDVGFQLSYLAVIAIIFFQERIYNLYEAKNTLLDKIWSLTVVSIAAQLGTSILSIYYFHQFPVYALFTNLFVVPVSFIVMLLAIALLCFSFFISLAKIIAVVLSFTITVLNSSTKFVEHLPFSTIEPISLNSLESILMHIGLLMILIYIVTKNRKLVAVFLIFFILTFGFRDFRFIKHRNSYDFMVFNVAKKSAFSVISNGNLNLYTDSSLYFDKKSVTYLTSNIMADRFVSNINLNKLEILGKKKEAATGKEMLKYLICMDSLKVLYLSGDFGNFTSSKKLKVNYLVLSKNAPMDIEPLKNLFDFDLLIADASVPKWKQEIIKRDCQQMEIPFYNVSESGAFEHRIQK